jgi:filamentous hemagglutinin
MTKMTVGPGKARVPEMQSAAIALCASAVWGGAHAAGPALPVPCVPGSCGISGPSQFVTAGAATAVAAQNALRINQTSNSAVLNWSSFNIAAGNSVTFQQPSSSSIALNKIYQNSPSQIFGQLNANGQVYLINLNGFVFGPTATVNVNSLLVSSLPLNVTDNDFVNGKGILSPAQNNETAAFDGTLDQLAPGGRQVVLDSQGNQVLDSQGHTIPVQVAVQAGAQLNAADQGRVLLAGQSVINGGNLTAPDGQVILAAGTKVYLQASSDPALRGLVVEVDQGAPGTQAWNQLTGSISAPRGNITMVGLAVNQDGRLSATTSVAANGSVRLEADTHTTLTSPSQGGTLTIGPHSDINILPELSSTDTATSGETQLQSSVTLLGEQVFLQGGSIVAPGGNLTALAASDPVGAAKPVTNGSAISGVDRDPNARLRVDPGVSIDLSGSQVSLPVTANLVAAQLRSAELADDPTQRNGPLHGQTVYVDARNPPSSQLANVSGEIAAIPQTVGQRTQKGGTAVFQSGGDVVFSSGASVNVSGGSSTYAGGVMQTSYLIGADGKLYPIATASPLLSYVGVLNPTFSQTYNKWGVKDILPTPGLSTYQPGYVQGASAGSIQFAAPSMVLQGNLSAAAVNGLYQRTASTAVSGGQLIIGLPGGSGASGSIPPIDYLAPAVQLTRSTFPIVTADDSPLPNPLTLNLPISYLTSSGITSTRIYSNYDVTLPAGPLVSLPAGSSLGITAARVNVLASITDAGGSLSFQNVFNVGSADTSSGRSGVSIGDGVTLDTSGLWTNDFPMASAGGSAIAQTWQNGGTISMGASAPGALLSVGNDVSLRANGGAWLTAKGTVNSGTGGSISLTANAPNAGLDVGDQFSMQAFGAQGAAGGTFNLTAPRVEIGTGTGGWTEAQQVDDTLAPGGFFRIYSNLFSDYGFQKFNIDAAGLVADDAANSKLLVVDPGTTINASVSTLYLKSQLFLKPSAANVDGIATPTLQAPYLRNAASVSLSALPPAFTGPPPNTRVGVSYAGDVVIGAGASITTDAGGSISLSSLDSVLVDGTLRAPGGEVSMQIVSPQVTGDAYQEFESGFLPNQRIDLGATGVIDVSGTFVAKPSMLPLDLGTLYSGGTINLFADRGAVVAERGSIITVAGSSSAMDILQADHSYGHELAASAGGSVTIRSGESIFLLGDLHAARTGLHSFRILVGTRYFLRDVQSRPDERGVGGATACGCRHPDAVV